MTAVDSPYGGPVPFDAPPPGRRRVGHAVRRAPGRLLRLELWHNAMKWVVPLLVALFLFDAYRSAMSIPPLWQLRASAIPDHLLPDFVALAAGVAAWMGSRDGRRNATDLVDSTAWSRWGRRLTIWSATAGWLMLAYLACVAVLYIVTARQATWGGPPWWPVGVGGTALLAVSAVAFAAGAGVPTRFTAPLAALIAFLVSLVGFRLALRSGAPLTQLSPTNGDPGLNAGVFYPYPPDLAIVQTVFLAGIAAAGLGVLGVPAGSGGRRSRRAAMAITVAGLTVAGTAVGLTTTAKHEAYGWVIPALHDAAGITQRPIGYTPICAGTSVPVCVHPAYRDDLPTVAAALDPLFTLTAELPGVPVRVTQSPTTFQPDSIAALSGSPPVLSLSLGDLLLPGHGATGTSALTGQVRYLYLHTLLDAGAGKPGGGGDGPAGTRAQQAVQEALLADLGMPLPPATSPAHAGGQQDFTLGPPSSLDPSVRAAAQRFAALPTARQHAWLVASLAALRAGTITIEDLP